MGIRGADIMRHSESLNNHIPEFEVALRGLRDTGSSEEAHSLATQALMRFEADLRQIREKFRVLLESQVEKTYSFADTVVRYLALFDQVAASAVSVFETVVSSAADSFSGAAKRAVQAQGIPEAQRVRIIESLTSRALAALRSEGALRVKAALDLVADVILTSDVEHLDVADLAPDELLRRRTVPPQVVLNQMAERELRILLTIRLRDWKDHVYWWPDQSLAQRITTVKESERKTARDGARAAARERRRKYATDLRHIGEACVQYLPTILTGLTELEGVMGDAIGGAVDGCLGEYMGEATVITNVRQGSRADHPPDTSAHDLGIEDIRSGLREQWGRVENVLEDRYEKASQIVQRQVDALISICDQ